MRIHTDKLNETNVRAALAAAKKAGRIPTHVVFKTLSEHGSRDYARSFEVQLESLDKVSGDGRRQGNSGSYGAGDNYSATYDEWGWFLSELYTRDEYMRAGAKSSPYYADDDDFMEKTGLSYNSEVLRRNLTWPNAEDGGDPYPFTTSRLSGTAGNKGRGRVSGNDLPRFIYDAAVANPGKLIYGYVRYMPRTLADVPA